MDKFAVDIEKVLDEFEYNEEREESIPSVINNHSLSITQKPFKSAASAYRRPTFEPINLADADFSAAPINPQNYTLTKQKNKNNNEEISNYINENFDDDDNDDNDNKVDDVVSEQPDLLDLNNKPAQNINEDPDYKLPDITSVTNIKEEEKLDLIKEEVKPVSFENDNVSESELEEYLQYLEEEESKKDEKEVNEIDDVEEIIVRAPSSEIYKITDVDEEDLLENDEEPIEIAEEIEPVVPEPQIQEVPEPQPEVPEARIEEEKEDVAVEENLVNENIENVEKSANQDVLENSTESIESDENERPSRPSSLPLESSLILDSEESPTPTNITASSSSMTPMDKTGKVAPFWVPDAETDCCMQCKNKFTVIRRRHHCRACGFVLCSKCCNLKAPLEYLEFTEARVCQPCFNVIYRVDDGGYNLPRQPNPNNPMEYCSTIPPLQQAASSMNQPPPSVLVPTGVLKREGRAKSDVPKQVIFSDGIRPGGDLTELDGPSESRVLPRRGVRRMAVPPNGFKNRISPTIQRPLDSSTQSYIPSDSSLPPSVNIENGQLIFIDDILEVNDEPIKFAINNNLFVNVKRVKLDCCVKRDCWSVSSEGLAFVGQDEIAIVLEIAENETLPPVDIFHLVNTLYLEASKGTTVGEMSFTPAFSNDMFGSKDHGGFLYIRPTFQCTTNLLLPPQPFLITILVHRWETPWARLFPLRLVLRLGAEYRYYPCPLVSVRFRPPLYTDIGHTVIKLLVDFRKYGYTLATVRGLLIHMEDRQTTILFPRNGYDQVLRALNNSNDSVLAFGANLSLEADSHLVCIQSTKDENTYSSQAINIQSKPRKVTGASFVVFNGALKTAGLSGKSSIVEDGLMVHVPSESMANLRTALREMKDYTIVCGPNDEETVNLRWCADDTNFNIGVKSYIDDKPLDGIPSIRVHNGTDYPSIDQKKIIRWTEVFILKSEEGSKATDPLDISRVSESIASATCMALVPMLDSLAAANLSPLSIRANIHPDNVGYEAGSGGSKLPTAYMNRLDEELIRVLHQAAMSSHDTPAVLELIFRIMNHP